MSMSSASYSQIRYDEPAPSRNFEQDVRTTEVDIRWTHGDVFAQKGADIGESYPDGGGVSVEMNEIVLQYDVNGMAAIPELAAVIPARAHDEGFVELNRIPKKVPLKPLGLSYTRTTRQENARISVKARGDSTILYRSDTPGSRDDLVELYLPTDDERNRSSYANDGTSIMPWLRPIPDHYLVAQSTRTRMHLVTSDMRSTSEDRNMSMADLQAMMLDEFKGDIKNQELIDVVSKYAAAKDSAAVTRVGTTSPLSANSALSSFIIEETFNWVKNARSIADFGTVEQRAILLVNLCRRALYNYVRFSPTVQASSQSSEFYHDRMADIDIGLVMASKFIDCESSTRYSNLLVGRLLSDAQPFSRAQILLVL